MDVVKRQRPRLVLIGFAVLQVCVSIVTTGCTSIVQPIATIPAHRVPREFLAEPQASKMPIDFTRLRQLPPEEYLLDAEDVLGIYIGSILGEPDAAPPVSMAGPTSDLPPAIGFPVPVGEDGTISLPLIEPVPVKGLTLKQVERLLFDIYTGRNGGKKLLPEDQAKIIVTLMEKRTYEVVVIRQDNPVQGNSNQQVLASTGGAGLSRSDFSSQGYVLKLRAYKNDVLNALAETGGLPGVNAKAEVTILRGNTSRWRDRDAQIREWVERYGNCKDPCFIPPPLPEDPNALRIPLRIFPGEIPQFTEEDIILQEGDVVLVESRDTELYYTGGTLRGGQFPLPRDFDLDVLGAIAIAGGNIGANQFGGSQGVGALSNGIIPPSELIILRQTDGGGQLAISVDLVRAINDPRSRLLVKAGDTLILRYKPEEELANFGIATFFTYGIRELFRN